MVLINEMRCEICLQPHSERHHIKTRGSGGKDEGNIIYLCRQHHAEVHNAGRWTFAEKYGLTKRFEEAIYGPKRPIFRKANTRY